MATSRTNRKQLRRIKTGSLILVGAGIVLLLSTFFIFNNQATVIKPGDGILATPVSLHDFGAVPVGKGVVSIEVPLVNIGEEDLIISFLDSSCGCTSARVINGGDEGPVFAMSSHGKSTRDWRTIIAPEKQAILKIYYDPAVHSNFRGPATRVITITSNERVKPEKQVRIKVNQVD
jgi:hypothetical protein